MKTFLKFAVSSLFLFTAIFLASSFSSQKASASVDDPGTSTAPANPTKPQFSFRLFLDNDGNGKDSSYNHCYPATSTNSPSGITKTYNVKLNSGANQAATSFSQCGLYTTSKDAVVGSNTLKVLIPANYEGTGYNIGTAIGTSGTVHKVDTKAANYMSFTYNGSSNGHYYVNVGVKYIGSQGTAPSKPALSATASCKTDGNSKIVISWSAVTGATGYDVQYKKSGAASWSATGSPASGVTSWTITTDPNTKYEYQVRSKNANGASAWSAGSLTSKTKAQCAVTPAKSCTHGFAIDVTPTNENGNAGDTKDYTVKITNTDSAACPADDTFKISKTITNNSNGSWIGSLDDKSLLIPQGGNKITTLHIKSPKTANSGAVKTINVSAVGTRTKDPHAEKSANVKYTVTGSTATKAPTKAPTKSPTAKPTAGSGPPTSPKPTAGSGGGTTLNITLGIDGIGTTPRIPIGGNLNPDFAHVNPQITVEFFNSANNSLVYTLGNEAFSYDTASKKFKLTNVADASSNLVTGVYNVYASGLPYLTTQYPGSVTITKGQVNNLNSSNFYMITGNIDNKDQSENRIDLLDYNVLTSCWIYSQNTSACDADPDYRAHSDLNGDGQVDQDDYTLLLKEIGNQQGAVTPDQ